MKNLKFYFKSLLHLVINDNFWCVIGTVVGMILAFVFYFCGSIDKATFWMVCALTCIMNLKG